MVELLVATICLAVTAMGIISAIGFGNTQNVLARQRMIALSLASSEMEKFRSKAYYSSITATDSTVTLQNTGLPSPTSIHTTVSATADPKVFNLTVQINWTVLIQSGNVTRSIRLDSVMRNNDAP